MQAVEDVSCSGSKDSTVAEAVSERDPGQTVVEPFCRASLPRPYPATEYLGHAKNGSAIRLFNSLPKHPFKLHL